jgi:hypothetical protein
VSSGTALAKPILRKKTEASEVHVSTNEASLEAPLNGTLWVLQLLGAILSFIVGFAKLSGDQQMTQTFAAIGIGQWIRYVTGSSNSPQQFCS